ncbi:hypothetical protein R6Q57_020694 [Mikania cordata]
MMGCRRYKKLLCMVDLTKDFFFSYSYHIMHSLQKNACNNENDAPVLYETMYLKRGVNEKDRVANDVETEQILFEDVPEGFPMQITSVVQNLGSIPLFWSQETSCLNIKPDITLSRKDQNYQATRLLFQNLVKRYGNPIIILNLIKVMLIRISSLFQKGVLRTNCIDCLDRTNVAQYAYGLAALGHQLHALGAIDSSKIDLDDPLAQELMGFYERMGDTLAHQYGGSAAHNKPRDGRPEVWELDSDQHLSMYRNGQSMVDKDRRSLHKKSLSDGNIIHGSKSPATTPLSSSSLSCSLNMGKNFACSSMLDGSLPGGSKMISESTPEISASCEAFSRCVIKVK